MKKILSLFIFVLISSFVLLRVTFAEVINSDEIGSIDSSQRYMIEKMVNASRVANAQITNVSVSGSMATITSTGSVAAYYIGTTNNVSANTTYSANSTKNTYYVGVKNGTYYFWVSGVVGSVTTVRYAYPVQVTSSCNNNRVQNVTGTRDIEMCYVSVDGSAFKPDGNSGDSVASCAEGYTMQPLKVLANTCNSTPTSYNGQRLKRAYCKKVFRMTCVPAGGGGGGGGTVSVAAPTIASLSVSAGNLSPGFSSGNTSYNVNVSGDTNQITINATAGSGSSFVSGYGPRTLNLSYGINRILVKVVNSAGNVVTYTVSVSRADNRSQVNTLSSLTISQGTLDPVFSPNVTTYNVFVPNNVTAINVGAVLTDTKGYFDEGYGPRTVTLVEGFNDVLIKVRSESGKLKTYAINISRETLNASICSQEAANKALLSKVEFQSGLEGEAVETLEIVKDVFTYNIKVPYDVVNPIINAFPVTEGDTFVVNGVSNLVVGEEQEATIVVTSAQCPSITRTYTIGVTRDDEIILSSNARISELTIEKHSEFKFDANKRDYELRLNKKETELKLSYTSEEDNAVCTVAGNENLKAGSKVTIECLAEDQESVEVYTITMLAPKKGAPVFLIILVVIIIILVLVYLIMRLLGYRIYFNFSAIGAFFRELKEKITNKD